MPVFESTRKIQVTGSSLSMTLPALFVKANEIEKGSTVNVLYDLNGILVISNDDKILSKEGLVNILEELEKKKMKKKII